MRSELQELWKFRELLIAMVQRELRIRYKNSALGFLWSFINPLMMTLVFWMVFSFIGQNGVKNYTAYVLAAYLPFMFVQFSALDASQSILSQTPVIKKIYFPREILPIATIIANFIHFLLGMLVFFLFLMVVWVRNPAESPFHATIVFLPFLMVLAFCIGTGFGLIVSALNTFYEDVKYVVTVGMNLLFYLCPVVYLSEMVAYNAVNQKTDGLLWKLYHLNPMATLCSAFRQVLLAPQGPVYNGVQQKPIGLEPYHYVWLTVFSFGILIWGYHLFNKLKWKFVERP